MINVYLITLLQAATVAELRGRVMGLLGTLSGGLIPLGMALGGVVGDLTGKNVPLIILVTSGMVFFGGGFAGAPPELQGVPAGDIKDSKDSKDFQGRRPGFPCLWSPCRPLCPCWLLAQPG